MYNSCSRKEVTSVFASRYKNIGLKIGYYRRMRGLTQEQLAEKVGISLTYIGRIERGATSGAALSVYWRIAEALDVTFEDLSREG